MDSFKIGILEPKDFSLKAIELLNQIGIIELYSKDKMTVKEFIEDKDIVFVRLNYFIDDILLENANKLKYICSPTTGLNHINTKRNINILSLKGEEDFLSTIRATSEHIFGLTLSLLRNYKKSFLNKNNYIWNREQYKGTEIYNNSVGIIGFGRIGKIISEYFLAFGAKVFFYDIKKQIDVPKNVFRSYKLEDLIRRTNIIILCVDYNERNNGFFDYKYFRLMENKYFINASRGEVIKEDDFLNFIKNSKYKGIAIDVLSNESNELCCLKDFIEASENKNVIITPHIGGATLTSMERTEEFIANKLKKNLKKVK